MKNRSTIFGALCLLTSLLGFASQPDCPTTTIKYAVPEEQLVSIKLFNGVGQEIATLVEGIKQPGFYQMSYDASKLSSGIYFCRMTTGNKVLTQKLLLQK